MSSFVFFSFRHVLTAAHHLFISMLYETVVVGNEHSPVVFIWYPNFQILQSSSIKELLCSPIKFLRSCFAHILLVIDPKVFFWPWCSLCWICRLAALFCWLIADLAIFCIVSCCSFLVLYEHQASCSLRTQKLTRSNQKMMSAESLWDGLILEHSAIKRNVASSHPSGGHHKIITQLENDASPPIFLFN